MTQQFILIKRNACVHIFFFQDQIIVIFLRIILFEQEAGMHVYLILLNVDKVKTGEFNHI